MDKALAEARQMVSYAHQQPWQRPEVTPFFDEATNTAIGSSLVAVTAFGLTTAPNYSFSGLVDWPLALIFIVGGVAGSLGGCQLAKHLAVRGSLLSTVFSTIILVVAAYMLWRSFAAAHLSLSI